MLYLQGQCGKREDRGKKVRKIEIYFFDLSIINIPTAIMMDGQRYFQTEVIKPKLSRRERMPMKRIIIPKNMIVL